MYAGATVPPTNYYNYAGSAEGYPPQQGSTPSNYNSGQYGGYQSSAATPSSGSGSAPVYGSYGSAPPSSRSNSQYGGPPPANSAGYNMYSSQQPQSNSYGGNAPSQSYGSYSGTGAGSAPAGQSQSASAPHGGNQSNADNSAVYITNIPLDATEVELAQFFTRAGTIKFDPVTCQPAVTIYRDKKTGRAKGDALIVFDNTNSAQCAVQWMNGTQLRGSTLHVESARKPKDFSAVSKSGGGPSPGGMPPGNMPPSYGGPPPSNGGYGMPPQGRGPPGGGYGPPPGPPGGYYNQGPPPYGGGRGGRDGGYDRSPGERYGGGPPRGGGGRGRGAPGGMKPGDWICTQCGNNNFKFRTECNRCKTPKSPTAKVVGPNDIGGGGGGGGGYGGDRGGHDRPGYQDRGPPRGRGRGGPMRGRGRGEGRPRPY